MNGVCARYSFVSGGCTYVKDGGVNVQVMVKEKTFNPEDLKTSNLKAMPYLLFTSRI